MKTLVIIDVQNDFMPGGALAVPNGDEIVPLVNSLQEYFDLVIATQDWHPSKHASFASSYEGKNVFETIQLGELDQVLWPDHCIRNSKGAEFHPDLETGDVEAIFRKGTDPEIDSYSGFYDNAQLKSTGLAEYLREKGATELYFCGLAGDYCVYYSIMDALKEGFPATLVEDATRAIDVEAFERSKQDILESGGEVVSSKGILKS